MNDGLIKVTTEYYHLFNSQLFKTTFLPSKLTGRQTKIISNFLIKAQHLEGKGSINAGWIRDFLYHTGSILYRNYLPHRTKVITKFEVNEIFSKKSLKWWEGRSKEHWYYYCLQQFIQPTGINLMVNHSPLSSDFIKFSVSLSENEELEKKRYYNTDIGFDWCLQMTTLYHQNSPLCLSCYYGERCKKTQKEVYPKIYTSRLMNVR